MKQKALKCSIKLTILSHDWKGKIEKTQVTNIKNKIRDITTDPADIKNIIMEYHKQLYTYIWELWLYGAIPQKVQTTTTHQI